MESSQVEVINAPEYSGFWRRFAAFLIDSILLSAFAWSVNFAISDNVAVSWAPGAVIGWLYYTLMESSAKQATIGKLAMGIIVTSEEGKRISIMNAMGRYFAKFLSAVILCIGFFMIAFTDRKQGLHDMLADTLVVKIKG